MPCGVVSLAMSIDLASLPEDVETLHALIGDLVRERASARAEAEALEKVAAAGVEISRPDKEPFAEGSREAYQLYEADTTLGRLIRQIKEFQQ